MQNTFQQIYAMVSRVPRGRVASYDQIARLTGSCTARQVGYAMAAVPPDAGIPWHRVINSRGEISARSSGDGNERQRWLLEQEGVEFDLKGRVDFGRFGWKGGDEEFKF